MRPGVFMSDLVPTGECVILFGVFGIVYEACTRASGGQQNKAKPTTTYSNTLHNDNRHGVLQ